jgi:hypothetical protein
MDAQERARRNAWMAANNVGLVATVCELKERGMTVESIASLYDQIQKVCGNEVLRASGANGGACVTDLELHMRDFGVSLAEEIASPKNSPDD